MGIRSVRDSRGKLAYLLVTDVPGIYSAMLAKGERA